MNTILKKSFSDIYQKKTRSILILLTLALAVAGVSLFGIGVGFEVGTETENREAVVASLVLRVAGVVEGFGVARVNRRPPSFGGLQWHGERECSQLLVGVRDFQNQLVKTT